LDQVKRGYRLRFAFIPGIAEQGLAADLDSVMTVEKAIIAAVSPNKRVRGCFPGMRVAPHSLMTSSLLYDKYSGAYRKSTVRIPMKASFLLLSAKFVSPVYRRGMLQMQV
jgi:hypothetical protein